ncbi:hypothetical protein [Fibrella forsythiae]|uniref:DUF4375 domain-containing protein n=1 Tax=Fibrella forsythiae TaxID=2817061 RepID=A0ABS3JNA6_9BACT|nr:hypothetical protein [Fibrella forsythiae]MBO0950684.1 hypothetical protein [Fibrella forsythiae]
MEIEKTDSIYNLLRSERFRSRPAMYLGKVSILALDLFIVGYRHALYVYGIEEANNIFNDREFGDFVAERYNRPAQAGWARNIWFEDYGDDEVAFRDFIRLFDEFIGEKKEETYYENLFNKAVRN